MGGLGGAVAEVPGRKLPGADGPRWHQRHVRRIRQAGELLVKYGLTADDIVQAVRAVLTRKK